MRVAIEGFDTGKAFTPEEVKHQLEGAVSGLMNLVRVTVLPDSMNMNDLMYFAMQQGITVLVIDAFLDKYNVGDEGSLYKVALEKIKQSVLDVVNQEFDRLVGDTEAKLTTE